MGFLSNLFKKTNKTKLEFKEFQQAKKFNDEFKHLLSLDLYIARSDYEYLIDKYKSVYDFFNNNKKANTLHYYCKKNKLEENIVLSFLNNYENILDLKKGSSIVEEHNENYIAKHLIIEKQYLDNILREVDPKIVLDEEQRKAILSDEDYSLIIAGAGAGKTTTVAAKVRYLVEKKGIDPNQILVISFTNKAVGELKSKINDELLLPCPITTFHSSGYAILRKKDNEKKQIVDEGFLYNTINNYLKNNILEQPELVDKLIMFFGSYFDAPYEGNDLNTFFNYISKADFSTLKSHVDEYNSKIIDKRTEKAITIKYEYVRSMQEVQIANFLFMHNIEYRYEETYPYHILKAKKPYTPDFCIKQGDNIAYIEHFGISESGHHSFYTTEQLAKYKQEINDKIALHKKHDTKLIYTFSSYNDGRDLLTHLKEHLIKNGFNLVKRPNKEIFEKLVTTEENKYISRLVKLLCVFINIFKTNGYTIDDFYRFERLNTNVRTKLFLEICKECYLEYQKRLSQANALDFQDMINDSARILREKQVKKEVLDFKYIIVDEYQDISRQRFNLTKELSKLCAAKIIAVGDDWQSIYAFSGSDITLFTQFCSIMGYGKELKITKTYRNAQEVIDIAGNFIQKNDAQIKKSLISNKHIQKPVVINTYNEDFDKKENLGKGGKYFNLGKIVEEMIGTILSTNKHNSSILLIGRYGFDARNLCFSKDFVYDEQNNKIFSKKYKQAKLEFLTAHSSKGLGYDNVIIINARNEIYGFPSKIEDDPLMQLVVKEDKSIEYAEERRLFYVAMTRTKNRVYIATPEQHPSEFILELINDYPDVTVNGNINKEQHTKLDKIKKCPICGYPLQLRYQKNYGLKLWICTNEPEICNFMTNDITGGDLSIQKCDKCKDGYLIIKKGTNEAILGCTNYKPDGTGCDRIMSRDYYFRWLTTGYEEDPSVDKPSYAKKVANVIPETTPASHTVKNERKISKVHTTDYQTKFIEQDGFLVVVDDEGQIITDMSLLKHLRNVRVNLAKENKRQPYMILSNKGLVSLATYRPKNKEEFISLYGLGEATYQSFGHIFINAINDFYNL